MAINWGLLQQPDIGGNAMAAFNQGQQQGQERATRNALSAYANDPSQIAGVIAADPAIGIQLQREQRQQAQQDAALARQGKQDARTEDQATRTRHREAFVGFMSSLASVPEAQRRQAAQQLLQTNPGQWTPEQVMQIATTLSSPNADFSDAGIVAALRAAGGDPNAGAYTIGYGQERRNPLTNEVIARGPDRPRTAPTGYQWNADETALEPIPGYVEGQSTLTAARRQAVNANPAPPRARASGGGHGGGRRRSRGGGGNTGGGSASTRGGNPWDRDY